MGFTLALQRERWGVCDPRRSLHFKVLSLFQTFSSVLSKEEEKWMFRNRQIGVYTSSEQCLYFHVTLIVVSLDIFIDLLPGVKFIQVFLIAHGV